MIKNCMHKKCTKHFYNDDAVSLLLFEQGQNCNFLLCNECKKIII